MGNTNSPSHIHSKARLAASKFDKDELHVLRATWTDLAERNHGKGIDKDTFLQYFPLCGLLGDRLFAQFDVKGDGLIDMDEFVTGLSICARGTFDEKIHFIFNMYDTSHDQTVSKEELTTLLNHVPKSVLGLNRMNHTAVNMLDSTVPLNDEESVQSAQSGSSEESCPSPFPQPHETVTSRHKREDLSVNTGATTLVSPATEFEEVDAYTNHGIVEKAFQECDLNHEGRLKYEEFKMWIQRTHGVLEYFESMLPFVGEKHHTCHTQKDALPTPKGRSSTTLTRTYSGQLDTVGAISRPVSGTQLSKNNENLYKDSVLRRSKQLDGESTQKLGPRSNSFQMGERIPSCDDLHFDKDNEEHCHQLLCQALELTHSESLRQSLQQIIDKEFGGMTDMPRFTTEENNMYKDVVDKESYLWKRGNMLHRWSKRWYVLSGNCIYYYAHKRDVRPRGVIFLTGCICDKVDDASSELKGYYGMEILHQDLCAGEHYKHESRILYCRSESEREQWLTKIQHAAQVVPIEEDYIICGEIGRGRFSVVCECVHKEHGTRHAVKIIEKASIEPEEKALLRTEIAVLKLVNHPNIIKLEGVYESRTHIYIVMEKLQGGELFQQLRGRPRFSEEEAAKLIRPILESVAYLHDLGIVHRDIKPENILCGGNLEDIKIADFGLSKMVLPSERMDAACGTLSYVAPEVLTEQGYGQETDLWSVGVIMFLVLCGKLPFDGRTQHEIICATVKGDITVSPSTWNKLSEDTKLLIRQLLHKNPKSRITAREALRHPFITRFYPYQRKPLNAADGGSVQSTAPAIGKHYRIVSDDTSTSSSISDAAMTF
mmetsp:Transcript_11288/g.17176  ORF Transcript_11288/g.17176 Transcript_11288/m.17176 type:complete len:828 (-) Transcript_11288:222-2705(-)|eukprot:CAMPEP_0185018360 /NCGR_PEP_ID=MMETSP1103-20130426/1109_1 /TAXON_ID=36769 /ORGANISM="Paraphysomonas bandaiensis, Strain Caron Lab Isolate" /LENGTH=827 /DNA_ID=CAMNT_0027548149 /DNA_START=68 /DNA_END=2551 /DNA_ORIENTATION=-